MTGLTGSDRRAIARARELAGLRAAGPLCRHTGETDTAMAYACAFGEARHLLAELAAIIERPAGEPEDTRRLNAIREVLSHFDWEFHDRQLALEAIERIASGDSA